MILALFFSEWDMTEVAEGITVSVIFLLLPVLWRMRVHAQKAQAQRQEHHDEAMAAHKTHAEHGGYKLP